MDDSQRAYVQYSSREKPPILPKYQGYGVGGSGASYRLASLDRLANRQRLFEGAPASVNGQNGATPDDKPAAPVSYPRKWMEPLRKGSEAGLPGNQGWPTLIQILRCIRSTVTYKLSLLICLFLISRAR